jgi:hypothetical protein
MTAKTDLKEEPNEPERMGIRGFPVSDQLPPRVAVRQRQAAAPSLVGLGLRMMRGPRPEARSSSPAPTGSEGASDDAVAGALADEVEKRAAGKPNEPCLVGMWHEGVPGAGPRRARGVGDRNEPRAGARLLA